MNPSDTNETNVETEPRREEPPRSTAHVAADLIELADDDLELVTSGSQMFDML
jgi:hypothetical protein